MTGGWLLCAWMLDSESMKDATDGVAGMIRAQGVWQHCMPLVVSS